MSKKLTLSKTELLHLLMKCGYKIIITQNENNKSVEVKGRFSASASNSYSYSNEWTDQEIRLDLVHKLLQWTGLHPKIVLDYL
jgi:hypothetical protein